MTGAVENMYLTSFLAPIEPYLARDDVTDIYVNKPGEIWLETTRGEMKRRFAPLLQPPWMMRLIRQIAAQSAQGISRAHPLMGATLPDGSRIQVVLPPATRGDIALAIRKHVVTGHLLEAYRGQDRARSSKSQNKGNEGGAEDMARSDDVYRLKQAVRDRKNILISGGTSSGKTSFLNALLREVPAGERLILIEDAPELHLAHANSVGLVAVRGCLGEADISTEDLLIATLRMRPDRIILGEIRGKEALTFIRSVNTGHPGSISTIHADSPQRALDQLVLLTLSSGLGINWEDAAAYIRRSIDIIVQLKRTGIGRMIDEIYEVT